jgi:hypothetical protein
MKLPNSGSAPGPPINAGGKGLVSRPPPTSIEVRSAGVAVTAW